MESNAAKLDAEKLDFAYKYPFSKEAKELVYSLKEEFDEKFLKQGSMRLQDAIENGKMEFAKVQIRDIKYAYLMSYIYARMVVSALNDRSSIIKFARAEAFRCAQALLRDDDTNFLRVAEGLNSGLNRIGEEQFTVEVPQFLKVASGIRGFELPKQELSEGLVYINKERTAKFLGLMIRREITKGLPIPTKDLPKEVFEYSRKIKLPEVKGLEKELKDGLRYDWIRKLLAKPIADVRHRTVNLILAPYLVNIRKIDETQAADIIMRYIERCKEIDPNTRINYTYIKYQCKYAKTKGLRPLSLARSRELLGGIIDFEELGKGEEK